LSFQAFFPLLLHVHGSRLCT